MKKLNRRNFVKIAGAAVAAFAFAGCSEISNKEEKKVSAKNLSAGIGGEKYIPFDDRKGNSSTVYFTRDLTAVGLVKIFDRVKNVLDGKIAIKLHTGEPHGPNIIPRSWVKNLISERLNGATIIETNTYYGGARADTKSHRKTLEINGWNFSPVDIIDADGVINLPIKNGKWFKEMSVGKNLTNYDSFLALTHFKGHAMGGFGGSNKNIGIGCADGKIGKKLIHSNSSHWDVNQEELMEKISESTAATVQHFDKKIAYINILRNMSVSCDCEGTGAAPVVTPNIGIVASLDILAADQASVDLIYNLPEKSKHDLFERMQTRHGFRQLTYMKEIGLGNDIYELIDIDNGDKKISAKDAVAGISGGFVPDEF